MVRIKDVAREAGVAPSTVSLVMNKKGYVSEETRRKVEAAMKKLHYVPSGVARSLSLNRTNTIGVIMPSAAHPFFGELIGELETALYNAGYKMVLCCTHAKDNAEPHFVEMLKRRNMDGIIMGAHSMDEGLYDNLERPVVAFDRYLNDCIPIVHCDHCQGGKLAAEAFLRHSCRHVVEIVGSSIMKTPADDYHRVAAEILTSQGVKVDRIERPWNEPSYASFMQIARQLFADYPDADGILGADLSVSACLYVAQERGLRVPEDVKLLAYDGTLITQMGTQPLTAIRQPIKELAELTVCKLIAMIKGEQDSQPWMIAPTFQPGATC